MVLSRFPKEFLLGLWLYLRQIELSVDRVLFWSWEEFIRFFETKISPKQVITVLQSRAFLKNNDDQKISEVCKEAESNEISLPTSETEKIVSALTVFSEFLKGSKRPSQEDLVDLRNMLSSCRVNVEKKIPKENKKKAQHIEHFNQNEILVCHSLEEILGNPWPK